MRRVLLAALLGALVLAGSASAAQSPIPYVRGTVVGGNYPIRVVAGLTPPVAFFGDTVTATVNALVDRKWVDPARLNPVVRFAPYRPVTAPTKSESENGRLVDIQWTWTLRCLTAECVPIVPPSDTKHVFRFPAAHVQYLDAHGKPAWTAGARFPAVNVLSNISQGIVAFLKVNQRVKWQYQLAPAAVAYRLSPTLLFWIAVLLAVMCVATAVTLATRWVIRLRASVPVGAALQGSTLEQALALFFWAGRHGDETLQRKALERVAAELPLDVADLSEFTRELAWSSELPEEDDVETISVRAGVPAHHENGAGE